MMKNILGQSIYMVTVLLIILMAGEYFIPEDCYIEHGIPYCTEDGYVRTGRRFDYSRSEDSPKLYSKHIKEEIGPSRHLSVLYTTFVFLQLFNQVNSRKLTTELNIFDGFFSNYISIGVFVVEVGLQIILTEFGRDAFSLSYKVTP